jgi:uncharacterized protein YdeI (YjbR/CyaY-like superfamily)
VVCLYKTGTARQGLRYTEALNEALCHGWIDGVRHRHDKDCFTVRFTPRKPRSIWSRVNIAHAERLQRSGRMTKAGLAAFEAREAARTGVYSFERDAVKLAPALAKRLRSNRAAWTFFQAQAPWYRRVSTFWIMSAKRDETRLRRLETLIECSAQGTRVPPLKTS